MPYRVSCMPTIELHLWNQPAGKQLRNSNNQDFNSSFPSVWWSISILWYVGSGVRPGALFYKCLAVNVFLQYKIVLMCLVVFWISDSPLCQSGFCWYKSSGTVTNQTIPILQNFALYFGLVDVNVFLASLISSCLRIQLLTYALMRAALSSLVMSGEAMPTSSSGYRYYRAREPQAWWFSVHLFALNQIAAIQHQNSQRNNPQRRIFKPFNHVITAFIFRG